MTQVFISYSRKDKVFADKLNTALLALDMDSWIDWDDIPPTADWWDQIQKGIENADAFLFLLSPDSVASKVCGEEIDHAVKNSKRLIPLVIRDANPENIHPALTKLNWIFFREQDDFSASLKKLEAGIRTDLPWVESQRRLQVRALEWESRKDGSLLLRGDDLHEAEEQLAVAGQKDPQPTDLQRQYILESRKRETRTRNITVAISGVAAILLLIASIAAVIQSRLATAQAKTATSRQLAAQSSSQMEGDYPLSVLLDVEAFHYENTIEARSTLLRGLQRHSNIIGYLQGHDSPIIGLEFSPKNNLLASLGKNGRIFLWDVKTRKLAYDQIQLEDGATPIIMHFSPDGATLMVYAISSNQEPEWLSWDLKTYRLNIETEAPSWCDSCLPNVYRATPTNLNLPDGHQGLITDMATDPQGKILVTSGTDGALIFWDISKTAQSYPGDLSGVINSEDPSNIIRISEPLKAHATFVNRVAWSKDGKLIASGDENGDIVLWSPIDYQIKTPSTGERAKGVDVSYFDGQVDWKKAKNDGVAFAFIRRSEGTSYIDPTFDANWTGLQEVGIPRSTYHFFIGNSNAKEQAAFFSSQIHFLPNDLPPVLDIEDFHNEDFLKQENEVVIAAIETWLTELERQTGKRPIIYSGSYFFREHLRDRTGQYPDWLANYPLWIATYFLNTNSPTDIKDKGPVMPAGWGAEWSFWQFTEKGKVDGIENPGDMNVFNGTDAELADMLKRTPFSSRLIGNPRKKLNSMLLAQSLTGEPGAVTTLAVSPDGKKMASGSANGKLMLWDLGDKTKPSVLENQGEFIYSVAFSPNGKSLAVGSGDSKITLWDVSSQKLLDTLTEDNGRVTSLAYNIDGSVLASAGCSKVETSGVCQAGGIVLWNMDTHKNTKISAHTDYINSLAFSPDGKWLASGGEDGKIIFWDAKTWAQVGEPLSGHKSSVLNIKFSHNAKWLASAGQDKTILLWDVATRQVNGQPLIGHERAVFALDFSPDDSMLASGSWDDAIILWDVATRQTIGDPLRGHTDYVYALAFSPDGDWLISGSWDNTIAKWDMRLESWISKACQLANRNFTQQEWEIYFPTESQRQTCAQVTK